VITDKNYQLQKIVLAIYSCPAKLEAQISY